MTHLEYPELLTTVVGSFPPTYLPPHRAIQHAVELQIGAGIELISDGQVRGDIIASFASRIPGFRRSSHADIWEVESALDLPSDYLIAQDYAFAQRLTGGRATVKGIVTGPVTLAMSCAVAPSAPYAGNSDPALILRLAEILERDVASLASAGATVIQIDEPVLGAVLGRQIAPELAHDALRALAAIPSVPALHVCGDIREVTAELLLLPFMALDFEQAGMANLDAFDRDMLEFSDMILSVGVVTTSDATVEPVSAIRQRIEEVFRVVPVDRVWVSPDCGMRALPEASAVAKLEHMAAAVGQIRAAR